MTEHVNARFEACLSEVLRHEGGYADHPSDPGGATNLGVTRKTLAGWRKVSPWWNLPKEAVKELARTEASAIYRKLYWDRCKGGALPAGLDLALFDFAVNSGPARAIKALQSELKVKADGFLGPLTLDALKARIAVEGVAALVTSLSGGRLSFVQKLATFATFGRGWTRRIDEVRSKALAMAGAEPVPTSQTFDPRRETMDVLSGYRTYIVAGMMLLVGVAQVLGIDLPALDGQSAGQLVMEALAIIFLRRGIKSDIERA